VLVLTSPDGALKLIVTRDENDLSIGFENYPWHTHGDLLLCEYETEVEEEALGYFLQEIVTGQREIVLRKKAGAVVDAWVEYHPQGPFYRDPRDDPHREPDETIEVGRWPSLSPRQAGPERS
jgi:hypothetical protein